MDHSNINLNEIVQDLGKEIRLKSYIHSTNLVATDLVQANEDSITSKYFMS